MTSLAVSRRDAVNTRMCVGLSIDCVTGRVMCASQWAAAWCFRTPRNARSSMVFKRTRTRSHVTCSSCVRMARWPWNNVKTDCCLTARALCTTTATITGPCIVANARLIVIIINIDLPTDIIYDLLIQWRLSVPLVVNINSVSTRMDTSVPPIM